MRSRNTARRTRARRSAIFSARRSNVPARSPATSPRTRNSEHARDPRPPRAEGEAGTCAPETGREPSMSLEADTIVDRRRVRRKLTFWRVLAILLAIVAVGVLAARFGGSASGFVDRTGASIARVKIQGLIRGDQDRTDSLDLLAKSNVRAVIVHVD